MKRLVLFLISILIGASITWSQTIRKEIVLPHLQYYITLKCDFHMHTVFSDGNVWPTTRVEEAWAEGLDAISITDHLEYTPHKDYVPVNHEAPFDIARNLAKQRNLILIKGIEITKSMPPGHFNVLFVKEAIPIFNEDYKLALREAKNQGAFVIWNHPGWRAQAPDGPVWMKEHQELYEENLFQGVEVANFDEWYPEVLDWAIEKKLTVFSNSDIHEPMDMYLSANNLDRRPITLVFACESSEEGIREALFARRTAGWFNNYLFARKEILESLLFASIKVNKISGDEKSVSYKVENLTDFQFDFVLEHEPARKINLPVRSSTIITLPANRMDGILMVQNWLHGADIPLKTELTKLFR